MFIYFQLDNIKSSSQAEIMKFTAQIDAFYEKWQQQKSQLNHTIEKDNQDHFSQQLISFKKIREDWSEIMRQKEKMK